MKHTTFKQLHQLTYLPYLFPINAYVFEEETFLTVIDVGVKPFIKKIKKLSEMLNKPVKYVILTHVHNDHIGGLDALKEVFIDVEVVVSNRESKLMAGDYSFSPEESMYQLKGGFKQVKTTPTRLVQDGDFVGSLKVIATSGHTPGSISLFDEATGCMIVGDAMLSKGGVRVAGVKYPFFPFVAYATGSTTEALKSAKIIQQLNPSCLATGHGKMIIHPAKALDEAIKEGERKLK